MILPELKKLLEECENILQDRSTEYSKDGRFCAFDCAARVANTSVDEVFRVMIAMKLSRIECGGNVHDSLIDACNYCLLWLAYKEQK